MFRNPVSAARRLKNVLGLVDKKSTKLGSAFHENQCARYYHNNVQGSIHKGDFVKRFYHSNPILSLPTQQLTEDNVETDDTYKNKQHNVGNNNHHNNEFNRNRYQKTQKKQKQRIQKITHEQFRHMKSQTDQILHNTPVGSMTVDQISETKSLIYRWYSSILYNPQGGNGNSITQAIDAASIMESLLERIVEEHEDGCNEDAFILTNKEYNVVMSAYAKCIGQYFDKKQQWMLNNPRQSKDEFSHINQVSDENKEHYGISKIEALYQRMKKRSDKFNTLDNVASNDMKPDIVTFNTILQAYSNQPNYEKGVHKAEEIMALLESEDSTPNPDARTYNALMNIYANQVGEYGYAQKAEDVLLHMSQLSKEGNSNVIPTTLSFNLVLKAWQNCGRGSIESAKRALDILRIMLKLYTEGHESTKPNHISIATTATAFTRSPIILNEEVLGHFDSFIDLILNESGDFPDKDPEAVLRLFNIIIDTIAKSNIDDAGSKANLFFKRLMDASLAHPNVQPDIMTYSSLIYAYIKDDAIEAAIQLINDIIGGKVDKSLKPNAYFFNKCLNYYCKQRKVHEAEALHRTMYNLAKQSDTTVIDTLTYNIMMEMYVGISNELLDSIDREMMIDKTISLLEEFEEAYSTKMINSLDIYPFEVVIDRLHNRSSRKSRTGTSNLSYDILMKMITLHNNGVLPRLPNRLSFNMVLSALSREYTKEAAEKAMEIIHYMQSIHSEGTVGVGPDAFSFSHAMSCLFKSGDSDIPTKILQLLDEMEKAEKSDKSVDCLNQELFELILTGLSNPETCDGNAARLVLEKMISLSKEKDYCKPTPKCFNLVLKAECMKKNSQYNITSAENAHTILFDWIKRYKCGELETLPDAIGFNTLIHYWAHTKSNDKVTKAEQILKAMDVLSTKKRFESLQPDMYTFTGMLWAYSRSKVPEEKKKAEEYMKKIEKSGGKLDTFTYNSMLKVWATSIMPYKAVEARELLDKMVKKNVASVHSFNAVLQTCTLTKGGEKIEQDALQIGLKTYNELLESQKIKANDLSFAWAINMVHRLSQEKEERNHHFKRIFDDCCTRGALGSEVIRKIKAALPAEERLHVLGHDFQSVFNEDWRSNAITK